VKYRRIESSTNLAAEVASVLTEEGPVLCEVMGLEDQQYVEVGYARNSDRKFVRRPLEDQWPFLERELFLREMIVAPVDQ
jgi:acetolactate synthase-1/2/3 large subunit